MENLSSPLFWEGASVLLTGASGLVGKAMLAKLVSGEIGRPKEVFVMLRQKKGSTGEDRLQDLIASPIFDARRGAQESGEPWHPVASGELVPVAGDLDSESLGIQPKMRARIVNSCTVVLSCAASTDFNSPLPEARNTNVHGALRMLQLAQECHSRKGRSGLRAFVHVSTCYVSANIPGLVEERLHAPPMDPEVFLQMKDEELMERAAELTSGFPNTYTFTKCLAEHLLHARAFSCDSATGDALDMRLPFVIVRPSIIGCSWRSPQPGWVDAMIAVAALVLAAGLGVARKVRGVPELITDIVPLDTVVEATLGAAVCVQRLKAETGSMPVVHVCTSSLRPLQNQDVVDAINGYFTQHPSSTKQMRACKLEIVEPEGKEFHEEMGRMRWRASWLKRCYCTRRLGEQLARAESKITKLDAAFVYFWTNEWIFKADNLAEMPALLQECGEPVQHYGGLQLSQLDWSYYLGLFCYGMRAFVLKEKDAFCPSDGHKETSITCRATASLRRNVAVTVVLMVLLAMFLLWRAFVLEDQDMHYTNSSEL